MAATTDPPRTPEQRRRRREERARVVAETPDRLLEQGLQRLERLAVRSPPPVRLLLQLTSGTVRKANADRIGGLAAEAALFTLVSLPALFLVVLGSLGYVSAVLGPQGELSLNRTLLSLPRAALPDATFDRYQEVTAQLLGTGRVDVIGLGLLLGLWTGSRATSRLLETITIAYDLRAERSPWRQRLTAIWLTAVALVVALLVLPLLVLGPRLARDLLPATASVDAGLAVLDVVYWPLVALLAVAALTQIYHVGAPTRTPWRRDVPGALVAVALCAAAGLALRGYLMFTGVVGEREGMVYQQLGTPIAIVFWIWGSSIAVLLGAELNAQVERTWPTGDRATTSDQPDQPGQSDQPGSADPDVTAAPDA